MEFDHADRTQGELPDEYKPRFQGSAKFQTVSSAASSRSGWPPAVTRSSLRNAAGS